MDTLYSLNKPKFRSTFSRENLNQSIIMPAKAHVKISLPVAEFESESEVYKSSSQIDTRTKEEIIAFHAARGDVPKRSIFSITNLSLNPSQSISNRGSVATVSTVYSLKGNGRNEADERRVSFLPPFCAEEEEEEDGGRDEKSGFGFDEPLPPEPAITPESIDKDRGRERKKGPRGSFIQAFSFPAKASSPTNTSTMNMKSNSNFKRSSAFSISSFQSSLSSVGRLSISNSRRSSIASVGSTVENIGKKRRVLQTYTPILPDELVIQPGDKVVLIHSFDDGWCVVGRKLKSTGKPLSSTNPNPFTRTANQHLPNAHLQKYLPKHSQSLSSISAVSTGDVAHANLELGTVPAWCFLPPTKGLIAVGPMRGSSLGSTVNNDNGYSGNREDVISWSNF